jgi:hypothetical protein
MAIDYSFLNGKSSTPYSISVQSDDDSNYTSVDEIQKQIDSIGTVDIYRGADFVGFIYFDSKEEIGSISVTIYTDDSVGLKYITDDGINYVDGGIELDGNKVTVVIPTEKLDELPDGILRYEMNIGFKSSIFSDNEQNIIIVGKFNANFKTLKYSSNGD